MNSVVESIRSAKRKMKEKFTPQVLYFETWSTQFLHSSSVSLPGRTSYTSSLFERGPSESQRNGSRKTVVGFNFFFFARFLCL